MDNLQILHQLVRSMTPDNLGALEYLLGNPKTKTHAAILFDILKNLEEKNLQQAISSWRTYKAVKQQLSFKGFENAKTSLKTKILEAKTISNRYQLGGIAEKNLQIAEVYIQQQNLEQAYLLLGDTIADVTICIHPIYKLQVLHKLIWLHHLINVKGNQKQLKYLTQLLDSAAHDVNRFHTIYQFNLEVTNFYKQTLILKSEESKNKLSVLNKSKLLALHPDEVEHTTATYLLKTKSMLQSLSLDTDTMLQTIQLLCAKMRVYEGYYLNSSYYINFIAEHINLSILAAQKDNIILLESTISYVQAILEKVTTHTYVPAFKAQCQLAFALYYYYKNDLFQLEQQLQIADDSFCALNIRTPNIIQDNIKLTLMKCWLTLNNFDRVTFWYGKRSEKSAIVRLDTFYIKHIIYFCACYEQSSIDKTQNNITVINNCGAIYIDLSTMYTLRKANLPLEHTVNTAFKILSKNAPIQHHKKALSNLSQKLTNLAIEGHTYQEQFYRIFDLRNWLLKMLQKLSN